MGSDGEALSIPNNPTFRPFSPIAFGFDRRQSVPSDPAKLLVSPASFDSFSQIAPPPVTDLDNSFPNANDLNNLWKRVYERVFSQDNTSKEKGRKDPAKDTESFRLMPCQPIKTKSWMCSRRIQGIHQKDWI